jgi:predicted neuraminidase
LTAQDGGHAFVDDFFSQERIARKPAYTVVGRRLGDDRGVQNPAIMETRDGVLVAAWSNKKVRPGGGWMDNHPSNTIQASYSTDGGKTWSAQTAASGPGSINAAFLHDRRTGDLLLLYNANHSEIQDDTSIAYRKSTDNGKTWGPAVALDTGFPIDIMVHSGIVLSNGEWLVPFHYDRSGQPEPFSINNTDFVASVVISGDRGRTWRRFGAVEIPNLWKHPNANSWAVETGVAETRGELVMILRTRAGQLYRASSKDMGRTWSKAEPLMFSNPDSKHAVVALRNGNLALFWNNTQTNSTRYPLMASLSRDGGRTWPATITVNDGNVQMDYPAAIEVGDRIKAVYGHKLEEIRMVELTERDFDARWTPVNNADGWHVSDGVLRMSADAPVENASDWLRWSKLIAFRYRRAERYTVEADFRVDTPAATANAGVAIFPGYQDEGKWVAWVWHPSSGHAGLQFESHSGRANMGVTEDVSQTWFERTKAQTGNWYHVRLRRDGRKLSYELTDRVSGQRLAEGSRELDIPGCFPALGSRGVKVSFDNFAMRED